MDTMAPASQSHYIVYSLRRDSQHEVLKKKKSTMQKTKKKPK